MQSRKSNQFALKFKLLNSQESNEEYIIQTSSDSSDFENLTNYTNINLNRTKKKRKQKKKAASNVGNLNVTIIDAVKYARNSRPEKSPSPILTTKSCNKNESFSHSLQSNKYIKLEPESPILTCKSIFNNISNTKSPILIRKSSPKVSPNVRKQLFNSESDKNVNRRPSSPVLSCTNQRFSQNNIKKEIENNQNCTLECRNQTLKIEQTDHPDLKIEPISQEACLPEPNSKLKIATKIKTFLDQNFGSESASQQSISDIPTPKNSSKSSEDIEISTIQSQSLNGTSFESIKTENVTSTFNNISSKKKKKIKYKKNELAYRLDTLLRRQNTNISLWQHEKFLAENSNFLIPKGEYKVFRIQKVNFKYGCYCIDAVDIDMVKFLILINSIYNFQETILPDAMIKIYLPYRMLNFDNFKLIINVFKFECLTIKI